MLRGLKSHGTSPVVRCVAFLANITSVNADCCLLPIRFDSRDAQDFGRIETCPHTFHFTCIKKWSALETTCPQCKAVFSRIERVKAATGEVVETIECESLFLWDHSDAEGGSDTGGSPDDAERSQQSSSSGAPEGKSKTLRLLAPDQLQEARQPKSTLQWYFTVTVNAERKKPVKIEEAVALTERHLKRTAMNDVCYAPPAVTYEAKPIPVLRRDSEFKLQPVYQEDFIAK
ncbi:RING-H2 finger protein ATL5 [Babesia bigemina]|uniref:RING-H2 finger protein ATL5 n=1 Tax=Babesia bigemina TaxID=5866 RepID=A0A061D2T9_BABBI|nr:RING-H2 finger protein ATL5 [Babesia bigemina]CDR94923.1 RING-H2 finger protein ATL5 [Babesia bigemina]|eukprot:XP_012767109.1 RING-H2 finger protein ATL5 [Babesia bigemina]